MPALPYNTGYQLEDGSGEYLLEDSSALVLEQASLSINNFAFVTAGDGISVGEKIR